MWSLGPTTSASRGVCKECGLGAASGVRQHWDRIPGEITGQMRSGVGWGGVVGGGSGVVSEGRDGEYLPIAPSCLHVPVTQELGTGTCDILFSGLGSSSLLIQKVFLLRGKSW